jgi:eukaryotic-like serine/threonine-protein kinase
MEPDRWQRIERLFESALGRKPGDRSAFLAEACEDDPTLRAEVEALIASDHEAGTFIERPAVDNTTLLVSPLGSQTGPGHRIGAYELIREIGRGGMGAVYLAVRADDQYRSRVAIKVVARGMDTDFAVRRFLSERQILASLDHPNIAKLLDGGATPDGLPYFVMEYIEGMPLYQYCDSRRLSTEDRLELFRTLCSAVHYAHQNLVVHRDLKPGNVLVSADGVPKLLDFGIAKLLNPELYGQGVDITGTAIRLMTPAYASPEQVRGEPITTASDVYSLGVLLYELLSGHRPYRFNSFTPQEILRVICEEEPQKPSSAATSAGEALETKGPGQVTVTPESVSKTRHEEPDKLQRKLTGDLDNIVLKAMSKEAQRRYTSVEQLSEDIRRYLEGLPVIARKATLSYRGAKFVRRNKAAVLAAALVVLSLLAGIIGTSWQAVVAGSQRARAEAEQSRAERRFNDVRKLANSFLFEFHDAIQELPGSTAARELVVKRALEYLDGLAEESKDDPSLRRELATAYEKVGDVQGDPYSASLGDTASALESYRKSLELREELVAADPSDKEARRGLAQSYLKVGDISWVTGDWSGALDLYQKGRAIGEELVAGDPQNREIRYDLSTLYIAIGDAQLEVGDVEEAITNQRKALAIREELATGSTESKIRQGVGSAHVKLADGLTRAGQVAECLQHYDKAIAIFKTLQAAEPTSVQMQRYLMNTAQRQAIAFIKNGEPAKATEVMGDAVSIGERIAAADPADAVAKRNLAGSYSMMAQSLSANGDHGKALDYYRKSIVISSALSAADPANSQARRDLMVMNYETARVSAHAKNLPESEKYYRKALELAEALLVESPESTQARADVADTHSGLGRLLMDKGDARAALVEQQRALMLLEKLVADAPENADFWLSLVIQYLDLARTNARLGSDSRLAVNSRVEFWREVRALSQKGLEGFAVLRERNAVSGDRLTLGEELGVELQRAEEALTKLQNK